MWSQLLAKFHSSDVSLQGHHSGVLLFLLQSSHCFGSGEKEEKRRKATKRLGFIPERLAVPDPEWKEMAQAAWNELNPKEWTKPVKWTKFTIRSALWCCSSLRINYMKLIAYVWHPFLKVMNKPSFTDGWRVLTAKLAAFLLCWRVEHPAILIRFHPYLNVSKC